EEYRLAGGRPRLIYIKTPAPDRDPRLAALLQEIKRDESLCYRKFSTPDELREYIENDLALLLTERFEGSSPHIGPREEADAASGRAGELPTGILTLVFTDIEGSTRMLQELGDRYEGVLADHHRIMREVMQRFRGREVLTAGDGFFIVFPHAPDAVQFAAAAQQALARHPWPERFPVQVRMGMHTGDPALSGGQYVGLCVNRAARIASAGHGGQVLLSEATRELAEGVLPGDITLRDMGMHRLKDLHQWEHLFQVVLPGLPSAFGPLRSVDTFPNNLPRKLTSFVGREREIAEIKELLRTVPLLSIVGSGGAGKTRLALQVAADLLTEFQHGAWFVELASVSDPNRVVQAVASTLGIRESAGLSLEAAVFDFLRARQLLLIVDNCEHLAAAAAEFLQGLLAATRVVQVLCTSREPLGIDGEKVWRIPSLPLPDGGPPDGERLVRNEAVRLFVDRAQAVAPGFALTRENAGAVARICVRLDGMPLAIELAAARVKVLTVDQITERLDDRFRLLAGGARTALPHHQTLRAALDWSHDLLSEPERVLLRRLSVFSGGWTLEAAEAVCPDASLEREGVLDVLGRLVDRSLVNAGGDTEARYTMQETIREYAHEKLAAAGEAADLRLRHGQWVLELAEQAEPYLRGSRQQLWLDRLEREWDNLQAALRWAVESGESDRALRLGAALWRFWYLHGHLTIGGEWLAAILGRFEAPSVSRARALNGAGVLAVAAGGYAQAHQLAQRALELARITGDAESEASARLVHSTAYLAQGDCAKATALAEETLAAFRTAGSVWGEALALSVLADIALENGHYEQALKVYTDSVALFRQSSDAWGIALGERGRGYAARLLGDYDQAVSVQAATLAMTRRLGDRTGMGSAMVQLGFLHWRQGRYDQAKAILEEALPMARDAGNRRGVADVLSVLGLIEDSQGHHAKAAEVLRESVELYRSIGSRFGVAAVLGTLGRVALHQGDERRAVALAEEAVTLFREIGDRRGAATSLRTLGDAALSRKDYALALRYAQESHRIFSDLGDRWAIGYALRLLAGIALAQGDLAGAYRRYGESLSLHRTHGDRLGLVKCLDGLVSVFVADGDLERAAQIMGSAGQMREAIGAPPTSMEAASTERCRLRLREGLGQRRLEALTEAGRGQDAELVLVEIGR
ncbi:MAG TPA: tetratricopeptide repeat protein, partial [bacterium]|nr:tetratricopeptide repeat protein [bacterium]